jgi:hypothetical protein
MAGGIADNLLVTTYLSMKAPVFIAPAMDLDMYAHPSTQRNIEILKGYGNTIIEAASGELASHLEGNGRLEEPEKIVQVLKDFFFESCDLKGMKVLITGHIQTGSYTKEDGSKVYTTDIIAEDQEFCEKKQTEQSTAEAAALPTDADGFVNVPDGIMEELPFARPEVKTDADKGSKKNR